MIALRAVDFRSRWGLFYTLIALVPLGIGSKLYAGPGAPWVQNHLGGSLYVLFWVCALALLWPSAPPRRVAALVLALTCALEVSQLWQPAPLVWLRGFWLGQALLGSRFSAADFPYYFLGAALALAWLRLLAPRETSPPR